MSTNTDIVISELASGDIVRHKGNGIIYQVIVNFGMRATAVKIADITNACEWELVNKAQRVK